MESKGDFRDVEIRTWNDERPRQAGTLGIDFTSSTRPASRSCQGHGAAAVSRKKPMSAKKFLDFLRALGLGDDATWAGVVEEDGELDRVVDKALHEVRGFWIPSLEQWVHRTLRLVTPLTIAQ